MSISAAQSTKANLSKLYKDLFPQRRLDQLALLDRPFLNWVPKADDLEGTGMWIPYRIGTPQGFSSQFYSTSATDMGSQNNVTSGTATRAFIEAKDYHGHVSIDVKSMRQARSDMGAFVRIKETELEDLTKQLSQELAIHIWKDGTGVIGVRGSVSGAVLTLATPGDVINFQPKQYIQFSETASGGTLLDSGQALQVAKVDFDAGTVTFTENVSEISGHGDGDFLFNRGNYNVGAASANRLVTGVSKWIPATAETSGTFLSMDRTVHVTYLQGSRQAFTGGSIEETVKKLLTKMGRVGARPDSGWLSFNDWLKLDFELQGRATREDGKNSPFGVSSLVYGGPQGPIRFMVDPFMPDGRGYLLKRDTWVLHHLDGLPHLDTSDGNSAVRGQNYDGLEMHVRMWMELACTNPKDNGTFATA